MRNNMSLKNKLFLIILSIATTSLLVSGYFYIVNINDIFNQQKNENIEHDKKILTEMFSELNIQIKSYAVEVSNDNEIQSSLNLIANYEDPKNYIKEIYDFEKYNLITVTKKYMKGNNISLGLFDKEGKLILLHRNFINHEEKGYISYDNNSKKQFIDYNTKKVIKTPFVKKIEKSMVKKIGTSYVKNQYFVQYVEPIYIDEQLLGYIRFSFSISPSLVEDLNNKLVTKIVFKTNEDNYIYGTKINNEYFKKIQNKDTFFMEKFRVLNYTNYLDTIFIVDRTVVNKKLQYLFLEILFVWLIILALTFIYSFKFINRFVLSPIENLKDSIEGIKNNNFQEIKVDTLDEIGNITKEFNSLSQELQTNISFLNSYKNVMDEGSIVTKSDLNGTITYANQKFLNVSGYTLEEVIGKPHSIIRHPESSKELFSDLWDTIQKKKVWKGIVKNKKKDGGYYWVDLAIQPILNTKNEIIEYIALRHDITELIEQREKLSQIINTDILTGTGNRFKLTNDIISKDIKSIAILNIDNFSQVNDFYGHRFGDELIVKISTIILNLIRDEKYFELYHLQGDEFVITNYKLSKDQFYDKIINIVNFIEHDNIGLYNEQLSVKFTTAISYESSDKILQTADMALKIARKKNLDFIVYTEENSLNKEYENNLKWTKKIKEAIEEDRVVPFFQAIVNNKNDKYEKYESLIRIVEIDGKVISPFFFLDIAKQTKYYNKLTKIMLKKSFETFKDKDVEFSVNLTVDDIIDEEIVEYICELLKKYKIGQKVVFEIVESESIENFEKVTYFIEKVKKHGCKIAIDDFGTGYSNFEYLMKLKADYIKIDGSMIKDIHNNNDARMVTETIVDFAKKMGIKTIAEFVENDEVLQVVKEIGIDYSQGYHFSEPKREII